MTLESRVEALAVRIAAEVIAVRGEYANKVGSDNSSVTGIEYYPTEEDLPATGVAGVIYVTNAV